MNIKKIICMVLVTVLLFTFVGCQSSTDNNGGSEDVQAEPVNDEETVDETPAESGNEAYLGAEAKLLEFLSPIPEVSSNYKIAALEITLANPFWVVMQEGYEAAAEEFGVEVDVMAAPKEDDVNSQLDTLMNILTKNYDAVAISAITPFNLIPGVAQATKMGIPVVAVGTSVDEEAAKEADARVEAFITSDFEEQGTMGAEFIIEKIGSGEVAIIEGLPGAAQGEARKNGAKKTFEANSDIELVSVQPGNWDRKTAYDIASNLIQAHPELKGIFCANDVMALGVVEALKAAGKKDDVVVVGVDFIEEAKDSIVEGELDATVAMSPYLFGKGGLILALKVLEGHELNEEIYWTPLGLVSAENVHTFEGWK
ncbi:sugar ABC transporter substrate-binding protein [Candidatus Contubernalis alkaliaceticus]|uniref:sugar ABC transporter substrate-binding protein n=1 Tax=Candidatus Contubernalis alkaliaceticus TaxID=338645 RepID=UPI001F4C46EE|nr:substrate-binding domain-containing protein [Candidatus Contubernalis alkalaceticus]UNC90870.1 substrate-binding domain-containing protein [Candidatus Contubernalis alkalaceticus]